jgi:hypothetical protein
MPNRIQINIQATPSATSKNGKTAQYLKERFNGSYSAAYLAATKAFWYPVMLSASGASAEEVRAAREESKRIWEEHWDGEMAAGVAVASAAVQSVDSFDDLEDDDE